MSGLSYAESANVEAIQTYLNQGQPEQAISTAHLLLSSNNLDPKDRKPLLELVLDGQLMIVKAQHYDDVSPAILAIQTLIKEFPEQVNEPKLIWSMIELYWNQNKLDDAQANILDLQNRFPSSPESTKSWLMLGKIHFIYKDYASARNSFLRYSIHYPNNSSESREVRMWSALTNYEEKSYAPALKTLNTIFNQEPELITTEDSIYSRYIQLLRIQKQYDQALIQSKNFLSIYKTSMHTPEIRLLQADLQLLQGTATKKKIIKAYNLLAESKADTIIGRQAFMRQMMLHLETKKSYRDTKPAIIALKRIANENQMSVIEDEAFLHEARLWHKVATFDAKNSPKKAVEAALEDFHHASKSFDENIAQQAKAEGKKAFLQHLQRFIQQQSWQKVTSLWKKFKQFQSKDHASNQIRFDVAHGFRVLFQFSAAETMLKQLRHASGDSVWGEKVILEQAKLWADRNDREGIHKIMQWLDKHEYTIYKPELLLVVAQMQMRNNEASQASHTLELIEANHLANEAKASYWQTKAKVDEVLQRWHMAAQAWENYAGLIKETDLAHINEAHARFKAGEYPKAELLYSKTPESLQQPVWAYRYSICQLKNGKWKEASERLTKLKDNPDAGIYGSMAALTIAERETKRLLETDL
ncbi:MAG: tetratricopeptide repeat protein [Ghiorsea sp.]